MLTADASRRETQQRRPSTSSTQNLGDLHWKNPVLEQCLHHAFWKLEDCQGCKHMPPHKVFKNLHPHWEVATAPLPIFLGSRPNLHSILGVYWSTLCTLLICPVFGRMRFHLRTSVVGSVVVCRNAAKEKEEPPQLGRENEQPGHEQTCGGICSDLFQPCHASSSVADCLQA